MLDRIMITALALGLGACASTPGEEQVARQFWDAMAAGDMERAKTYAKPGTMDGVTASEGPKVERIDLQGVKTDGGSTVVPTRIVGTKDGKREELSFDTVLERDNGVWKVDFDKTLESMLGFSLKGTMEAMGKAMGEALEGVGKAVGEGLGGGEKPAGGAGAK